MKAKIARILRAVAEKLSPVAAARWPDEDCPRVWVLSAQHKDGWAAGGAVWIFDSFAEFEKAKGVAARNPSLVLNYSTDNAGAADYTSDASEFKRWAEHITSEDG